MPQVEVCLSPALLHLYNLNNTIVIIIDVFRATSTIAAALHNGAAAVWPVTSVAAAIALGNTLPNSITAGEREGKVAYGLQYGNSPLEYTPAFIANKNLVLTTTNGTKLLHMATEAHTILTASFLNVQATINYLQLQPQNVLIACAAWKDVYNLEDHLCAGAIVLGLQHTHTTNCDSARVGKTMYTAASNNLYTTLQDTAHYKRLSVYGLQADMAYCCNLNQHPVVVKYKGDKLAII